MKPKIISISYALPENSYSQDQIFNELAYPKAFKRLFSQSAIDKRHFWVPLDRIKHLSWQEQQEWYKEGVLDLSKRALLNCLDGRDVKDIGCVVFSSCTGFLPGPVAPHYLSREFGFEPSTYFRNLGSHGCEGGFPGLRTAMEFTMVSGKPSIAIACELASCSYFPEPGGKPDPENHFELARSNALFGDAACCILVGFDNDPKHPVIVDSETYTDIRYLDDLGYTWRDGRLRVLLSRRVPEIAAELVSKVVPSLLKRQNLGPGHIEHWIIHAAGSQVLDNIRDRLGLPEEKLSLSREVLREVGNCSSTTIGIIGKMLMEEGNPQPGEHGLVVSIGPGMTAGCTLLHWEGEQKDGSTGHWS